MSFIFTTRLSALVVKDRKLLIKVSVDLVPT